jgi:hypothetical protein
MLGLLSRFGLGYNMPDFVGEINREKKKYSLI